MSTFFMQAARKGLLGLAASVLMMPVLSLLFVPVAHAEVSPPALAPRPTFDLSIVAPDITIRRGTSVDVPFSVNRMGSFAGSVRFSSANVPVNVIASFRPARTAGNSGVLRITVKQMARLGTRIITIRGASGMLRKTMTLRVTTVAASIPAPIPTPVPMPTPAPVLPPVSAGAYDIGAPILTDLWINPVTGNDEGDGRTSGTALRTLGAAWSRIPATLTTTGYRINILPGSLPCEGDCLNFFSEKRGTYTYPILIRSANGPGTVTLLGGLNLLNIHYVYLIDLALRAGAGAPRFGNNVLHMEAVDHVLIRGVTFIGVNPRTYPSSYEIQEVIKANQSDHIYIENSDVSGTYQTGIDLFSVQYGHIINTKIHDAGEWCGYVKGGSAYFRIEGNELYNCGLGFQAGEGSNFEVMRAPWLHYDAYDIKFVNNVLHDIPGTSLSVSGGYNILFAHNTLYKIATRNNPSDVLGYPLLSTVFGGRGCLDTSENGVGNSVAICGGYLNQGGWGTTDVNGGEWIPNKNIFIYNNLFLNPDGMGTRYGQFDIRAPLAPPSVARNIPIPARADENLQIRGNVIWNGPEDHPLGVEETDQGCQPSNASCNASQLRTDNRINTLQPQLQNPTMGDFRPRAGGNIFTVTALPIPTFTWSDAPMSPSVPVGNLSNVVNINHDGVARVGAGNVGAY